MSIKLKALGLGLLALIAVSGFSALNASATTSGHFTSDKAETTLFGTESATHRTEFIAGGFEGIICTSATYHGTINGTTTEDVTLTPTYKECETTNKVAVTVNPNGCTFTFTSRAEPEKNHATVHVVCPAGKAIVIHHPSTSIGTCEITIPAQTVSGAIYKTDTIETTHAITAEFTIEKIKYELHGFCSILGTNKTDGKQIGSATLKGKQTDLSGANITAT